MKSAAGRRAEITRRIAVLDRLHPEVLAEVERVVEEELKGMGSGEYLEAGGVGTVVDLLTVSTRGVERDVILSLEKTEPDLAEEIKKRMFVFEDIRLLDPKSIKLILGKAQTEDLLLAMKGADKSLEDLVWGNMTENEVREFRDGFAV